MPSIVSLNLNGIRSACRKGVLEWLQNEAPDIVCAQELKAQEKDLTPEMQNPGNLRGFFSYAERPGYSGVGIYARKKPQAVTTTFGDALIDSEGRFIQLDFAKYSALSLYLPSGSSGDSRQQIKYGVMKKIEKRMARLMRDYKAGGREVIICADWNIAHTKKDIRNWRGNQKNSGFLPEERQWIDNLLAAGWVDVFRQINDDDGEYTWWSNRGNARANNVGWRIDYQLATPGIAQKATTANIYKTQRFSDHAPLTIRYK